MPEVGAVADPAPKPRRAGAERVRRVNAKQPRVTPAITITGAGPMTPAILDAIGAIIARGRLPSA